ncbi:TcfC E-set like domain-containing protein [Brevundimonas naejangsanensis]|uniref:TcfC E-set like domain-containing protein n=1 Tax=Brevundimonas naejangsanensis TaxID=588932 RepID=UPI0034D57A7E
MTVFDVYFEGRRVGTASGRLASSTFHFDNPAHVADLLAGADVTAVTTFLSGPLPSNETLRCLPGQTIDCGVLLNGATGVIVNPDNFRVDIFLGREMLLRREAVRLGEPVSGPSFIQGISASVSANNNSEQSLRLGLALDTVASVGRNSVVSRIFGDDERGLQVDEVYAQRYGNDLRASVGLFTTEGALALSTLRLAGAKVSSFYGGYLQQDQLTAGQVDILLPRPARVEIYRDGVLISSSQYAGGLQTIDASRLPAGSYPIRVVARDASGVVLDEIRSFTRATDLPPPGKFVYSASVGTRMSDNFASLLDPDVDTPFFPEDTGEFVVAMNASRRVGEAIAVGAGFTMVDSDFYPEVSTQFYMRQFRGFASAATGPGGQYATVAGGSATFGRINASFNVRVAEALPLPTNAALRFRSYRPFLRDERSVNMNIQAPARGGAVGFRASYGEFEGLPERYAVAVNYNRPVDIRRVGTGVFGVEAIYSDNEVRVGFRFTLVRGRSTRGSVSTTGGLEYIKANELGGRDGIYPVAQVGYTRSMEISDTELALSALGGVSNGDVGAQGSAQARSRLGEADVSIGVIRTHNTQDTDAFLTGNMQTGFVYGGGKFHVGGGGMGEAAVIAEIKDDSITRTSHDGRFRVLIDDIPYDTLRAGQRAVVPLSAFTEPRIALAPDAAPPFEIDLSARSAPLYPGNVVVMTWNAQRVVTAYGRVLGPDGQPRVGALVSAGTDIAITGDGGYFSVTGPIGADISIRSSDSLDNCASAAVMPAPAGNQRRAVANIGVLTCPAS